MKQRPLFWLLFPSYALVVLSAVGVTAWFLVSSFKGFYFDRTRADLEARAEFVRAQLFGVSLETDRVLIDSLCHQLERQTNTRITVVNRNGAVVADSDEEPSKMENHAGHPEIAEALSGRFGLATRYSHTLSKNMMYAAVPIMEQNQVTGVVRTSLPVTESDQQFGSVTAQVATIVVLIAVLAAAASWIISRRIVKPLAQVQTAAEAFSRGDFVRRLPLGSSQEISQLAATMNAMAEQLDEKIRLIHEQTGEREAILSSMIEGVIAVDNDERIISVNVAGAHMLGVTESDARGKYVQEVLRLPELQRFISRTLKAKGMQEAQFDLQERLERIVQGHGTPLLSSDGSGMGAVIVLHDITHILRLEGVRRDFVANVSHELRTPITSIKGFVETLRDGALDSTDDSRRFLEIIARQTDHLNSIINDLLTLSQLEQPERDQIGMSPTNVKSVLEHAISTCQHRARKQDVALKLKSGDSIVVTANPSLLEQAVVNLIDNAIKYSPSGSAVDVTATSTGSLVTIAVIDRGSGIERAHLSRLFERFYRVDIARSRELGGTGLGLAIVKHIVSAHNGTVVVDSTPGKGSTFTISLPQT